MAMVPIAGCGAGRTTTTTTTTSRPPTGTTTTRTTRTTISGSVSPPKPLVKGWIVDLTKDLRPESRR